MYITETYHTPHTHIIHISHRERERHTHIHHTTEAHTYIRTYIYIQIIDHALEDRLTSTNSLIKKSTHTHQHTYITETHKQTHTYIYIRTYTYVHIHTHIHTQIHTYRPSKMLSKIVSQVQSLGLKRPDQIVAFTMGFTSAAAPALTLHLYGTSRLPTLHRDFQKSLSSLSLSLTIYVSNIYTIYVSDLSLSLSLSLSQIYILSMYPNVDR